MTAPPEASPLVAARGLDVSHGRTQALFGVDVELHAGEVVALVGPNGAGKSTLLGALVGWHRARAGTVTLGGEPLARLDRREIARRVAFVPQDHPADFAFTVRELVALGRIPHLARFDPPGERDEAAVRGALARVDLTPLSDRPLGQLSGGERQRAFLARALAQGARALLLDEPTASLDLSHQLETLELLRELARGGDAVLLTLHDLGLAARYADRLVVLSEGRRVASGPPAEVLTAGLLRDHFRVRAEVARDAAGTFRVIPLAPLPK